MTTITNNKLTDERLAQIKDMATDAGFCYGKEWGSALVENGLMKYHAITSDFTENVVAWGIDDSLESSWLCDYLAALSPTSVLALIAELQERRKADSEPVAYMVEGRLLENMTQAIAFKADSDFEIKPLYVASQPALDSAS